MSDEMEIVSDTGSSDANTLSGHSDEDDEAIVAPMPLLAAVIGNYLNEANIGQSSSHAAAADADDDDSSNDATQPLLQGCAVPDVKQEVSSSDKPSLHEMSQEDDGQMCTICFEPWTSSGEHRLISLRCGHLFGRSCISRWLKGQGSRCPQCNARARKSEIRPIFARCLKVLDTTERDRAIEELDKEIQIRKKSEFECAQLRLKVQMAQMETENLKKQLMDTQSLLNESRWSVQKNFDKAGKVEMPVFKLLSKIELQGCCRVMDCSDMLGLLLISQPSYNPLFHGFGLKKISIPDMKLFEYIHLHQKPIRDVAFHSHNGLVLTASLDKTVKLTNCLNNKAVQTYNLDCEAWSCAWDLDDSCYFYAGVRTGSVYIYDIRMTDRYVDYLTNVGETSPVVSIQYLKRQPSMQFGGPIVGQLFSCSYYEKHSPTAYEVNQMPLEGKLTSLSYDAVTNHLLASFRPSSKHPVVTHALCEIKLQENQFQCNLVQCMTAGTVQAHLTRSKLVTHPTNESSVLVCAGEEEKKSAVIWDGSNGSRIDSLKAESVVLDITTFRNDHNPLLATLTEKELRVYNWAKE